MKKLLLILAIATSPAIAIECDELSGLAETVMTVRQNGLQIRKAMAVMDKNQMTIKMVTLAYERPMFSTESYKQKSITEYGNLWYLACLESENESK